jgi:hypothetical protein
VSARPRSLDGIIAGTGSPRAQEERIAARIGGRRVPGSGASPYARGDVKEDRYLVEAKQTAKDSMRVTWAWLAKITRQAVGIGRVPALAIELRSGAPRDPLVGSEWVMLPLGEFERLLEVDRDARGAQIARR